jgi:hypothetical protein
MENWPMNPTEWHMLDLLKKGRDHYGVVAVKAEFEAEGTRPDEMLRLLDLARRADLKVALKIGGCEAVSDLHAARLYAADYVIAPMVETPYALTKFAEARDKVYGADAGTCGFLFNLETAATLAALEEMLPIAAAHLDGIVFGRVDFTLSKGMPRGAINDRAITDAVLAVSEACIYHDLEFVVGGSVAVEAAPILREIHQLRLDRFETRKVVFDGEAAMLADFEDGIANAMAFELAWLENKRDTYRTIADEDGARIAMLRERILRADSRTSIAA